MFCACTTAHFVLLSMDIMHGSRQAGRALAQCSMTSVLRFRCMQETRRVCVVCGLLLCGRLSAIVAFASSWFAKMSGAKPKPSDSSPTKTTSGQRRSRERLRSIAPLNPMGSQPLTPSGYDLSPILFHPSLRSAPATSGGRHSKLPEWYELINSSSDFEEAWIIFRDRMNEALFERMAIATPYLRDAIFYNLNAAILRRKPSGFCQLPLFQPAGPLHRLCAEVVPSIYERVSVAKPSGIGPWLSSSYRDSVSHNHHGVKKEIEVEIDTIYRSVNDEIPKGAFKVNMDTLMAIWSFDEKRFLQDVANSPLSPFSDAVFENENEFKFPKDFAPLATSTPKSWPQMPHRGMTPKSTPRAPLKFSSWLDKLKRPRKPKWLYVIHELIYAESIAITVRVGEKREVHHPSKFLRSKRAFPVGFAMTKYKIDKDGWLEKKEVVRAGDCIDDGWNVVSNLPWPAKPPDPIFLPEIGGSTRTTSDATSETPVTLDEAQLPTPHFESSQQLIELLREPQESDDDD